MAFIFPDSTIELYSGIEITAGQQIAFASTSEQNTYFQSHRVAQSVNCTYVRKTGRLKVEYPPQTVAQCNYIGFRNASFENRVFFARIMDYEYVNNVTTEIRYAIDWFQSFCFEVTYEDALIEREHLSSLGYTASITNPYSNDQSLYEFWTDENLSVGKSIEEPNETVYALGDELGTLSGNVISFGGRVPVFLIADFDKEDFENYDTFEECFACVVPSSGNIIFPSGNKNAENMKLLLGFPGDDYNFSPRFPHGFSMYCLHPSDSKKGVDALNWLTLQSLTQQIIGIYSIQSDDLRIYLHANVPLMTGGDTDYSQAWAEGTKFKAPFFSDTEKFVNTKLYRYPFMYLRVGIPNGNNKEYQWEKFTNISSAVGDVPEDAQSAEMRRFFMIDDTPRAALVPVDYNQNLIAGNESTLQYNLREKMVNADYSQVGFNTDGYLTFLSNTYMSMIGASTEQSEQFASSKGFTVGRETLGNAGNAVGIGSSMATKNGVNPLPVVSGGSGILGGYQNSRLAVEQVDAYREAQAISKGTAGEASEIVKGDIVSGVFGPAKPAYAADIYHAPTIAGVESYYAGMGYGSATFYMTYVRLSYAILKQYDHYFSLYGYTSNRVGTPRVCNYVKGSNDVSETPHWDTTTGKTITYIKTSGMKVISPMKVVSDYIEQLFDAGVRFLKGDTL